MRIKKMDIIKDIRKNLDSFKKKIEDRNVKINFDELIKLDKTNRDLIKEKELLEQKKKYLSKSKNQSNFKI